MPGRVCTAVALPEDDEHDMSDPDARARAPAAALLPAAPPTRMYDSRGTDTAHMIWQPLLQIEVAA
jgi:hypothetical protein